MQKHDVGQHYSKCGLGPAISSPVNLREMPVIRPYPRPTESETPEKGPRSGFPQAHLTVLMEDQAREALI